MIEEPCIVLLRRNDEPPPRLGRPPAAFALGLPAKAVSRLHEMRIRNAAVLFCVGIALLASAVIALGRALDDYEAAFILTLTLAVTILGFCSSDGGRRRR